MQEHESALDATGPQFPTDPGHLFVRLCSPTAPDLVKAREGMLTGVSLLVPDPSGALAVIQAVTESAPPDLRVEVVIVDPPTGDSDGAAELDAAAAHLDALAWPWRSVPRPVGGRADALDAAVAASTGELVLVVRSGAGDAGANAGLMVALPAALTELWVNAGDALILDLDPDPDAGPDAGTESTPPDRGLRIATALGMASGCRPSLVVLRRWVARFLFDGLGLAIDPLEEILDRVRLLDMRLIEARP